jgi:hypothetical protein
VCFYTTKTRTGHGLDRNPAAQQQQSPPYRGVLSFRSEAREASDSETARVHHTTRRRSSLAARGACAAAGDAVSEKLLRCKDAASMTRFTSGVLNQNNFDALDGGCPKPRPLGCPGGVLVSQPSDGTECRARALGISFRAQRGTGRPLAALGTPPPQHCPEVRCDARAHSERTIE